MDPTQTLKDIRKLSEQLTGRCCPSCSEAWLDMESEWTKELVEKTTALDEWLSGGGFLPEPWRF